MDINFIQETIDSLRTLTRQNGALIQQNSQLINETVKESTLDAKTEEIKQAVQNAKPEIDTTELAKESTLQELLNRSAYYDSATGNLTIENVNITIQ